MKSPHPLLVEWLNRLNRMESFVASTSQLTWLYEIRTRVLKYFVSRYGLQQTSTVPTSEVLDSFEQPEIQYHRVVFPSTPAKWTRPSAEFRDILEQIHETALSSNSPYLRKF